MKNVDDEQPGSKPAAAITLSGDQQYTVRRARRFLEAAEAGPHTLAAHLAAGTVEDTALFYAADGFGAARQFLADLRFSGSGATGRMAANPAPWVSE